MTATSSSAQPSEDPGSISERVSERFGNGSRIDAASRLVRDDGMVQMRERP